MDTFDADQSVGAQPQKPGRPKPQSEQQMGKQSFDLLQWIGLLDRLESAARYLFLGMAAMSFVAYGYMVYTQDQWQSHHRQLQKLRNQESQQAIINARIRNQAAELAEKNTSGTIDPSPSRAVFVPITEGTSGAIDGPASPSKKTAATPAPPEISITVGY